MDVDHGRLTGLCKSCIVDCLGKGMQKGDPRGDSQFTSIVHG